METAIFQCRACLCLETDKKKHKIITENGLNDIFRVLTQIQIPDTTTYNKMCQRCVRQLKNFLEFRQKCLRSQQYFNQILFKPKTEEKYKVEKQDADVVLLDEESGDQICDKNRYDNNEIFEIQDDMSESDQNQKGINDGKENEENRQIEEKEGIIIIIDDDSDDQICQINQTVAIKEEKDNIEAAALVSISKAINQNDDDVKPTELTFSHNDGLYECDFCGRKYHKKSFLHGHIKQNHIEKDFAQKGNYECHLCERKYRTDLNLQNHLANAHNPNKKKLCPFKCDKCEKNYKSKKHLRRHTIQHINVHNPITKIYTCLICHKGIDRKFLTKHIQMHTEEKRM